MPFSTDISKVLKLILHDLLCTSFSNLANAKYTIKFTVFIYMKKSYIYMIRVFSTEWSGWKKVYDCFHKQIQTVSFWFKKRLSMTKNK